jgi:hypothetical protein
VRTDLTNAEEQRGSVHVVTGPFLFISLGRIAFEVPYRERLVGHDPVARHLPTTQARGRVFGWKLPEGNSNGGSVERRGRSSVSAVE